MHTPILLISFNRPHEFAQLLSSLRDIQPKKLYIFSDGPRNQLDKELIKQTRGLVTKIDWECDILTLFQKSNLGCKDGPIAAISWFFDNNEQGIVLEDDCIPTSDFFCYCNWALTAFKDQREIWHINGNNFNSPEYLYAQNIDYISLPQVWGWASWSDRWKHFSSDALMLRKKSNPFKWNLSWKAKIIKWHHLSLVCDGFNAWDYLWQITVLNAKGLCVSPRQNLVSNIGDSLNATHTRGDSSRCHLETGQFSPNALKRTRTINKELLKYHEQMMGLDSLGKICFLIIKKLLSFTPF